jgi:hypothetical protein
MEADTVKSKVQCCFSRNTLISKSKKKGNHANVLCTVFMWLQEEEGS